MWRWLEDSDIPPQNEFPYRLRRLSGHLGRRQHSERNPGHNQYDYRVGPIHSATLVHTSESCLDFCSFCSQKTGRNPSVRVIFNAYEGLLEYKLPCEKYAAKWTKVLDTSKNKVSEDGKLYKAASCVGINGRSVVLLKQAY